MRCFLAIPLPEETIDRLAAVQARIPVGRTTPPENLHVTLVFLDDVGDVKLEDLHLSLSGLTAAPLELRLSTLDLFGGTGGQILFAGVQPDPPLIAFQQRVERAARAAGIALQRRRYRPHVTLARLNRAPRESAARQLAGFLQAQEPESNAAFRVDRFCLYRSDLGHGPARHTELASYDLIP